MICWVSISKDCLLELTFCTTKEFVNQSEANKFFFYYIVIESIEFKFIELITP